ncbi:hypothetical protein RDI58_008927 [Solanum bulbocastanum]|uniref:Chitin-binding type-1 domain-containing protein n=1 Tax=Solanum bulbocastanum TaxID=147425 RepID=A0AAN8YJ01_SOLBU
MSYLFPFISQLMEPLALKYFKVLIMHQPAPPPPPPPPPQYRCGMQKGCRKCNTTGDCCSIWGWCGPTYEYCSPGYCQMQCPGPYPEGRCGWQADGKSQWRSQKF